MAANIQQFFPSVIIFKGTQNMYLEWQQGVSDKQLMNIRILFALLCYNSGLRLF